MKQNLSEIMYCPLCKNDLNLHIEESKNGNISKGTLTCINCKNKYQISDSIPRLYIPDDEIIKSTDKLKFNEFIITSESLAKKIENNSRKGNKSFVLNKKVSKLFAFLGWLTLFLFISLLILSGFHLTVIPVKIQLLSSLILISFSFFFIDYLNYRKMEKIKHITQLHNLVELSKEKNLSEYDSRTHIKDEKGDYQNYFDFDTPCPKSKKIASMLDKYSLKGNMALHIGCGGELHKSVSKPYFDKGFNMLGVDIFEDYLKEYSQLFNTGAILTNSMALPFRNETFDIINFTDILEHLHHPFVGLCEAQRILKKGGVIILATPYRCRIPKCINPLNFIQNIISLYVDNILPPRSILSHFQDMSYYHLEFSKNEITKLLKESGFDILIFDTYFAKRKKISKILNKIPVLKFMGPDIMVVGKKMSTD